MSVETENKTLTGYPSIDKPWLKYYSDEAIKAEIPKRTLYENIYSTNSGRMNEIAIEYYGAKITFKMLFEKIKKTACAFSANGIKAGDNVTIMSLLTPETIYCIYALNFLGATANMVYVSLSEEEIINTISNTSSKMLIALDISLEKVNNIVGKIPCETVVISISDSMPLAAKAVYHLKKGKTSKQDKRIMTYSQLLDRSINEKVTAHSYQKDYPALIVYTSGTTGEPKGVVLTNDSVNAIAFEYKHFFPVEIGDSILSFMPPFLAIGFSLNIHMPLSLGMKLIVYADPERTAITNAYIKCKPLFFVAAPFNIWDIISNMKGSMSYCKAFGGGGESFTIEQENEVNRFLAEHGTTAKYCTGYGMTEFSATVSAASDKVYKVGSLGIPLCKTIVKIVDPETNEELKYNETGEMCFNTPSGMLCYYKNDTATNDTIKQHSDGLNWIHTGDLGCVDEDGVLFFKGRLKRIYMTKGKDGTLYKIFPTRVEELLMGHPKLGKCAVAVIKDEALIHKQLAFLMRKESDTPEDELLIEIDAYCAENLPDHSIPCRYVFVEELPLTQSGKVDYRVLEKNALEDE